MELFSIEDYARIELAGQWGLDKLPWEKRIEWATIPNSNWKEAESPVQYHNALDNYLSILEGKPTNATISLDATCSCLQHIAILMGCEKTARISNVIGGDRNDAYSLIHTATGLPNIPRKKCKEAVMTSSYGGVKTAKEIYRDKLDHFYSAMNQEAPAALAYVDLTQSLWNSKALNHEWVMPDNFHVSIPVEAKEKSTVSFMGQALEVTQTVNKPSKYGKSLSANIIHSLDSLVVRELVTRCSQRIQVAPDPELTYRLDELADLTGFRSARILYYRDDTHLFNLPKQPFNILPTHDSFKVLLPYANDLRMQYSQIMHELAHSQIFEFILYQLTGEEWEISNKPNWGNSILEADYAIC